MKMDKPYSTVGIRLDALNQMQISNMSCASQLTAFMPFSLIKWGGENTLVNNKIEVPKDYIRSFCNVKWDNNHFNVKYKERYIISILEMNGYHKQDLKTLPKETFDGLFRPYTIHKFTKDSVIIEVTHPEMFTNLGKDGKRFARIETSVLQGATCSNTLVWYLIGMLDGISFNDPNDPNLTFYRCSTYDAKQLLGLSQFDYCSVGTLNESQLEFVASYTQRCTNKIYQHSNDELKQNLQSLVDTEIELPNNGFVKIKSTEHAKMLYDEYIKQVHFHRLEFEKRGLTIPLNEICMYSKILQVVPQKVLIRAPKGKSATKEERLFSKTYPLSKAHMTEEDAIKYGDCDFYDFGKVDKYVIMFRRLPPHRKN